MNMKRRIKLLRLIQIPTLDALLGEVGGGTVEPSLEWLGRRWIRDVSGRAPSSPL